MKLSMVKKYRKRHSVFGTLLLKNPVLVTGLALPFIIAASISLRGGLAISMELLMVHTATVTAGFFIRRFPFWQRMMLSAAISTMTMLWARQLVLLVFPGISGTLGMYLYLIAVNGMTLTQASTIGKRARLGPVMSNAVLNVFGFTFATILMALFREVAGAGTLMGVPLAAPFRLEGLLLPFGGFMVLAFLLAGAKFFNKKLLYLSLREIERKEAQRRRIRIVSEELV